MDTTLKNPNDPYNAAITAQFRARKAELRLTFPELVEATGIKLRQLKALFNDEVPMHLGDFMTLSTALQLDPRELISAGERVSNSQESVQR